MGVIWLVFVWTAISEIGIPNSVPHGLLCLLCSLVGAILVTTFLLLLGILVTMIYPQINCVIGRHEYEITGQGFLERNESAETLSFWHSIKAIILVGPYIYVRLNAFMFVVIPRHGFATEQDFKNFYQILSQRWNTTSP